MKIKHPKRFKLQTLLNILLFQASVTQNYEMRLKKNCCPNKLPECVASFCCLFLFLDGRFTMTNILFIFRTNFWTWIWIFGHSGKMLHETMKWGWRKIVARISCPNVWRVFLVFFIFRWKIYHDNHTFYISDKFLNLKLDIRPLRAKCCTRL